MDEYSTDELIEKIRVIGVKLPTIDYEYDGYRSELIENMDIGEAVRGIEVPEIHATFREACYRIIEHFKD